MTPDDAIACVTLASGSVAPGSVVAIECDGEEFVLWRGRDGRVRGAPRRCPHLGHDLAEGYVVDDELVCAGHAWAFDGDGHAYKRNEFGRADPKGSVDTPLIREHDTVIEASGPARS
jgi:phenylpropionate dioxygenase-like ring-hydroxylating dioxygenase large terminal subunit